MTKQTTLILKLIAALAFVTACTKTRQAELPDEAREDIYAISDFGTTSDTNTTYSAKITAADSADSKNSIKALDTSSSTTLSGENVTVPERLKFMFDNLTMSGQSAGQFKITFSVDKDYVTSYKVVTSADQLTALEKSIAISSKEAQIISKAKKATAKDLKAISAELKIASAERANVRDGKAAGSLLVPMFKYKVESYGVLERTKNDLKENTSVLALKKTDFKNATHIQISSRADARLLVGMTADQRKQMDQLYVESKIDNQVMTADELESRFNVGMKFIDGKAKVLTRLDSEAMHVYEITKVSELNENQLRLLKNNAGNNEVMSCKDETVAKAVKSDDKDCVVILKADIPVKYVTSNLTMVDMQGNTSNSMQFDYVPKSKSIGLVEILTNTTAKQASISGTLDPDSSIRLADLKGEFLYRRTFEDASNMFLGRTGTSGDMSIVQFELEDKRLVVRNQQSLIQYTGQGAKDREEIMSFPVKYVRMSKISDSGAVLSVPVAEVTTKEKAEYAIIDWTQNTIPNASSPLAFYADGACFMANSSQRVTGTDMRLATDGVLNFSLSGSYTMQPTAGCVTVKETNSAYWAANYQFNFNISERISFRKRKTNDSDKQFSMNISAMAQEAFNFGVFTLADKVTDNGTLTNRDGSEKYMPIIHDFRNGKMLKYYIGGINNREATSDERRQLLIEATQQVIKEWNATLRYAFRGTSLERAGDYVQVVVDEGENTGHLGDLDRNYIWYQELEAENGLLGVAQPAGNPRSGTIEAANVIIYSGNTYNQTERLIAYTTLARQYEKKMEEVRQKAIAEAKAKHTEVSSKEQAEAAQAAEQGKSKAPTTAEGKRLQAKAATIAANVRKQARALKLNDKQVAAALRNDMQASMNPVREVLSAELLKKGKGKSINLPMNETTFTKKLAALALRKDLMTNPHAFELEVNNAFRTYGGLDEASKATLLKKAQALTLAVKFDENNKNRPGCFKYERTDIEDEALSLDADPKKNIMKNFKLAIMSTLSHELGHAFGLLHNFKASTDLANYEFPEDKDKPTGRNYSSIMDYIADIDLHYAGPGPYDAHALRAAYTGLVDLPENAKENPLATKVKVQEVKTSDNTTISLVAIEDVMKAFGQRSLVHFTKDTLNTKGLLKYYEQCSDGGIQEHATCAQFDVGSSATEIVKNKIADYNRGYTTRNYVYDKITFNWPEKVEIINRNLQTFASIRGYLDEAVKTVIFGSGRSKADNPAVVADLVKAAQTGYQFFHEVIRTPDAKNTEVIDFDNRFYAVPYQYAGTEADAKAGKDCAMNAEAKVLVCNDVKVVEARSLYDVKSTRDKINTIGISYDKIFAMQFLLQSSVASGTDDSNVSMISYLDFEKWFMGVSDPSRSLTLATMLNVMTDNLKAGFFAPSRGLNDNRMINLSVPVEINRYLGNQTAIASVISLAEAKWQGYDPFAEVFKIGRSYVGSAPQDRINVVQSGQDRTKSDSRVYYPTQGSVGGKALVTSAARLETMVTNKVTLYNLMTEIFKVENQLMAGVAAAYQKACAEDDQGKVKDEAACNVAKEKTDDQVISEDPQLAALKFTSKTAAEKLVATLRKLNSNGAIMPKELDKPESEQNFEKQVEVVRANLLPQLSLVVGIMKALKAAPADKIQEVIGQTMPLVQAVGKANSELAAMPLYWLTFSYLADQAASIKVQLATGEEVTGAMVAEAIVDSEKLTGTLSKLMSVIEDLGLYTGLVDPDTVSNR